MKLSIKTIEEVNWNKRHLIETIPYTPFKSEIVLEKSKYLQLYLCWFSRDKFSSKIDSQAVSEKALSLYLSLNRSCFGKQKKKEEKKDSFRSPLSLTLTLV